jgi:hypothetical protein
MWRARWFGIVCLATGAWLVLGTGSSLAAPSPYSTPRWWTKYESLLKKSSPFSPKASLQIGSNVDASNEDGPQSETSITVDPNNPSDVVGGSNEILRDPMRAYFSSNGGKTFGAVDLPLPPPASTNGNVFGSDPGVAFDSRGNAYYSYVVVFANRSFKSFPGSEMAVAKSSDGGATWPRVTFFHLSRGSGGFNDKPMIAVDANPASPFRDSIYVAWDTLTAGKSSSNNALVLSRSTDGGKTFSAPIALNPPTGGPSAVIGADPFVGPNGEVYVAWHDVQNNRIMVSASVDGGATFGAPTTVSPTAIPFSASISPQASRGALVYPACGADRSTGSHRGTLYCSWMDGTSSNGTDIFVARSSDRGQHWSAPQRVNDDPAGVVKDQFNQWLSVDPVTGAIDVSWNDPRADPADTKTDVFATASTDGGVSFAPNVKVTSASSDESSANQFADAGNQYGDYEGIVGFGGTVRPIWTDGRLDAAIDHATGQRIGEEIFTTRLSIK